MSETVKLKLTAENPTEQRILDYLIENASAVLAEKINAGKKTLAGAVNYATDEARKMANGSGCVCVDDATVFGWVIHFFEEDSIQEKAQKSGCKLPGGVRKTEDGGQRTDGRRKKSSKAGGTPAVQKPKGPIIPELFSNEEMQGAAR